MRLLLLCCLAMLAACGQTGPLYLPDEGVQTPIEIRGPTTPAAAETPAPDAEEEEQTSDQPPGR